MRIWDISPGYLNRQSLLGEHRELHGIVAILTRGKKGYANHPETRRWAGYGWSLRQRHRLLAAEMALRGFVDRSPVILRAQKGKWPATYIDAPARQLQILKMKYQDKEVGRIPLPENAQQFWGQHKYSVLARDEQLYSKTGRRLAGFKAKHDLSELVREVTELLRRPPTAGGLKNVLQHMWGHVSRFPPARGDQIWSWPARRLLQEIQQRVIANKEPYLGAATALSELTAWLPESGQELQK